MKYRMSQKNMGSAVVEMTLLIPILLGIIYLYISLFLFMMGVGSNMSILTEVLYRYEEASPDGNTSKPGVSISQQGNMYQIVFDDENGMFHIHLEMRRYGDVAIENIRRWQFAFDTVQAGKNE